MVKVISGTTQTSGVYLTNPSGYVLTASRGLGISPKVVVETSDGTQTDGWIVGRDDSKNLALVEVSGLGIPSLSIGSSSGIKEGTEVLSFGYMKDAAGLPFIGQAQVTGIKNEYAIGLRFIQFDIEIEQGVVGGPVVNREGDVVGINVGGSFLHSLNIAPGNSGYALVSDKFKSDLTTIKEGYMRTADKELRPALVPTSLSPPPQPIIFSGVARSGGLPVSKGERIWARVYGSEQDDLWMSALIGEDGKYKLTIGAVSRFYINKPIEFYLSGKKHPTTPRFTTVDGIEVFLDLVF
ncbi:MAG: serine protease, S1-C subfamily, contains C-terminal PDZ domain [Chloroflexi bacterium]|nr:MAG: serine protease, S1-C subfamily, contains C-terminal PDZ domain [Chloroflexota bacterium]